MKIFCIQSKGKQRKDLFGSKMDVVMSKMILSFQLVLFRMAIEAPALNLMLIEYWRQGIIVLHWE